MSIAEYQVRKTLSANLIQMANADPADQEFRLVVKNELPVGNVKEEDQGEQNQKETKRKKKGKSKR